MKHVIEIYKHFWIFIRKYKLLFFAILLLVFLSVLALSVFVPLIYKSILDTMALSYDRVGAWHILQNKLFLLGVSLFAYLLFSRSYEYLFNKLKDKVLADIQFKAFKKIITYPLSFFENNSVGYLSSVFERYTNAFEIIIEAFVYQFWKNILVLTSAIIVLTYFSKLIGLSVLLWVVSYAAITWYFLISRVHKDKEKNDAHTKVVNFLSDILNNILNVKIFSSVQRELRSFYKILDSESKARINTWNLFSHQNTAMAAYVLFFELFIMSLTVWLWSNGQVSVGMMLLIQIYIFELFNIVWDTGQQLVVLSSSISDTKAMLNILRQFDNKVVPTESNLCNRIHAGDIQITNLNFAYGDKQIFNKLNLSIKNKEKVALVGPSGSGKTTIIKLIMRFVEPNSGKIVIDGVNIKECPQEDLLKKISYIPQEPILFNRSIKENIAYAKPDASLDEIRRAAKLAYADDFINALPDGYDTIVGEGGSRLSGGQKQRIALARVFLEDAPILILDEATSALDAESEQLIQSALDKLMQNKTVITIAHKLATVKKMDRIIVFKDGIIVEEGTHDELIEKEGVYAFYYKTQVDGLLG